MTALVASMLLALAARYLDHVRCRLAPKHFAETQRVIKQFCADHEGQGHKTIRKSDLHRWLDDHPEWRSAWTKKHHAGIIRAFFSWLAARGHLGEHDVNPLLGLNLPSGPRGRPISEHHYRAFLRNSAACFRRVLVFAAWTGARPAEISALEWDFIDCEEGTATLWMHKTARSRTDGAPRVIYLHQVVIDLLLWIRRNQPESRYVFLNSKGRPWNSRCSMSLRLQRLRRKLNIPKSARMYGIRHAWATKLAKKRVGLKSLAELLGHTSVRMSEYYVSLAGDSVFLRSELARGLAK